jgi:glycosyltransferase involved in cell wall biosynthesis
MKMQKSQILIFSGYYLPGYKAGGAMRTIVNMVDHLGDEFEFKIITADRDLGDEKPYPGIKVDGWSRVGKADVFYMSPKRRCLRDFRRLFCFTEYDVIYFSSFFSPHFTIKPLVLRGLRLIPDKPVVVAPEGEFSPGALGLKRFKKRTYLFVAKAFGLYRAVVWKASSEHEEADIRRWFSKDARMLIAQDLPPIIHAGNDFATRRNKVNKSLKIIFLSRISRKKNLDGALKMLSGLKGQVKFDIYGPMEDETYWAECQKIISRLSENIEVRYCGSVEHGQVDVVMREHDLFFLPTLGENHGHVMLEAMVAGCPVLISDQTPWRHLEERGVGWDLPLDHPERFQAVLQKCVHMDQDEHAKWSKRARKYGLQVSQDDKVVEQNRQLFHYTVGMRSNSMRRK